MNKNNWKHQKGFSAINLHCLDALDCQGVKRPTYQCSKKSFFIFQKCCLEYFTVNNLEGV